MIFFSLLAEKVKDFPAPFDFKFSILGNSEAKTRRSKPFLINGRIMKDLFIRIFSILEKLKRINNCKRKKFNAARSAVAGSVK